MMVLPSFELRDGFDDKDRGLAAKLYWQAFGEKMGALLGPDDKAIQFFKDAMDPKFAISAYTPDGQLLGMVGYKTSEGALAGGTLRQLVKIYGVLGVLWRAPFLSLLERGLERNVLLMDGIFVSEAARGKGVGTALLQAIKLRGEALSMSYIRLDVIDTNPRARALYEKQGFVPTKTEHIGPLKYLFGFSRSTEMRFDLRQNS